MQTAQFIHRRERFTYVSAFRFPGIPSGCIVKKQISACRTLLVYKPASPLSRFIEQMWLYSRSNLNHVIQKFIPDGSNWLVIDFSDHARDFLVEGQSRTFTCQNSWITGTLKKCTSIAGNASPLMLGINFKAGGAYPFFDFPLSEITNSVVSLDLIWGREITDLRQRLLESPTPTERFGILECFLLKRLRNAQCQSRMLPFLLQGIQLADENLNLKKSAERIAITQKHLISLFNGLVGLTPKRFQRISRFQKVIRRLEQGGRVNWPLLALEFGYYDQAHFIKEFQEFAGMSPTCYPALKGEVPNHIHIRHTDAVKATSTLAPR